MIIYCLYKDESLAGFLAKYLGLLSVIVIFYNFFLVTCVCVRYTRIAHLPFGSIAIFDSSLVDSMNLIFSLVNYILKDMFSISVASFIKNIVVMATDSLLPLLSWLRQLLVNRLRCVSQVII